MLDNRPVRSKSRSWIELLYPDGAKSQLLPMGNCRGIRHHGVRPYKFIWHNPYGIRVTPSLINWLYAEFAHIFTTDSFTWAVCSANTTPELEQHLKEIHV